jgi:hypothetical protein
MRFGGDLLATTAAGVWDRLQRELLHRIREADRIDWSRACVDSSSIAAKRGDLAQAQTRRIEANPAPNVTWSRIADVSRLPSF